MKKSIIIMFLSSCIFLSGCATGQLAWKPEYREQVTSRIYDYDYNKVFNAVLNRTEANGYSITTADKENGLIITGYKSAGGVIWGSGKMQISYRVIKLSDNSTKVKANFHCEGYSNTLGIYATDDLISEEQYWSTFEAINDELKNNI